MREVRRTTWNWLAPRLSPAKIFERSESAPRPALPAVEPLDDRVLLSVELPAADSSQILIGLLKSQLPLVNGELAALKVAEQLIGDDQLSHKLLEGYLKLDTALFKFGESLIKGEYKLEYKIDDALLKIDELVSTLDPAAVKQITPILHKVNESAIELTDVLSKLQGGELEHASELVYLKLGEEFYKINEQLLKIGHKLFGSGLDAIKVEYEFLKFEYEFLKVEQTLHKLEDLALLKVLAPAIEGIKAQTLGFIQGFLNLDIGDGGVVIGSHDVVTLAAPSDDLIEELE